MKYKVIASVLIVLLLVAVLALKGCSGAPVSATDENGNSISTESIQ